MIRSLNQRGPRQLVARELDPTKLVNIPGPVCPEAGEAQFMDWAKDAMRTVLSPIFEVSESKGALLIKAQAPAKRAVSMLFSEKDHVDVIVCFFQNEEGGAIARQEFPTSGYAKYAAMVEDVITWVCDRLFVPDRRTLTPAQQLSLVRGAGLKSPPQDIGKQVCRLACRLPQKSVPYHVFASVGLKKLAALLMQREAIKMKDKEPTAVDYRTFRQVFQQARGLLIKSLSHLTKVKEIDRNRFPKRMLGRAAIDMVDRFDKLEKEMLTILETPAA